MSRLDSFIRRLEAQRAMLDLAAAAIAELPGPVLELGLGNGRTYDHLRQLLPARRIIVFERDPQPHPECRPRDADLVVGDLAETLPRTIAALRHQAALVHSDIGTGDPARNRAVAAMLGGHLPELLRSGGLLVSDQPMNDLRLEPLSPPPGVDDAKYFMYRRR